MKYLGMFVLYPPLIRQQVSIVCCRCECECDYVQGRVQVKLQVRPRVLEVAGDRPCNWKGKAWSVGQKVQSPNNAFPWIAWLPVIFSSSPWCFFFL